MACVNADGSMTVAARTLLAALEAPRRLEDVAAATGLPLYRVRSGVRELVGAGLVEAHADQFVVNDTGRARRAAAEAAAAGVPAHVRA